MSTDLQKDLAEAIVENVKKPRLTKKQKGFVKDYVKTGNGSLAVKENYDVSNDNVARVIASENLTKPNIQKAIADSIPDELLTEKHLELLNKKEVIVRNNVTTGEIETIPTGEIDVQAVAKGLDMAYKIKKQYEDKGNTVNIQINSVSGMSNEELEALLKERNETI